MKAYRVTFLVVDHDQIGAEGIKRVLENQKFPNHCMHPTVLKTDEADLGEWDDSHPLNQLSVIADPKQVNAFFEVKETP